MVMGLFLYEDRVYFVIYVYLSRAVAVMMCLMSDVTDTLLELRIIAFNTHAARLPMVHRNDNKIRNVIVIVMCKT